MPEEITIAVIPDLLREAYLAHIAHIAWNINESILELYWDDCLIRNTDGTEIKDRTILLRCTDMRGIAAGTEPLDCFMRPSTLPSPGDITADYLKEGKDIGESWAEGDRSWMEINNRRMEQEVLHSLKSTILFGTENDITESPVRVIFNVPGGLVGAGKDWLQMARAETWEDDVTERQQSTNVQEY